MPCPNCRCLSCLAIIGSPIPSAEFPPPSSELMTANRAPTNSEVAYSRNAIGSSEKMISLIQTMIDDLEKRKAQLLDLITKHKAAISPLRSFPPEILTEIFVQFISMLQGHWRAGNSPPLMLMRICSRWRGIVLDTPRLWTKIFGAPPMIDSWIVRSKDLPLHLELDFDSPGSYPILQALIPHAHRWEHVNFSQVEPNSLFFLTRTRTRLHSLKSLNISFDGLPFDDDITTNEPLDFCEVAPRLTEVRMTGIYKPVIIELPWEQPRACTLDGGGVTHYVLQHTKNLRVLLLDMSGLSGTGPWLEISGTSLHSDNLALNVLIIKWSSRAQDMNLFFSSITLPALQTLKIHFDFLDPDDLDHAIDRAELGPILARFFERSCTHLSSLELVEIPFSQSVLIECLFLSPSLVSLDIRFDSRWNEIGEKLLYALDANFPGYILPCLRSLALRGPVGMSIEGPLDALIASRRHIDTTHHGAAMLENLVLECSSIRRDSECPQFQRFVSEGLNIIIERIGT